MPANRPPRRVYRDYVAQNMPQVLGTPALPVGTGVPLPTQNAALPYGPAGVPGNAQLLAEPGRQAAGLPAPVGPVASPEQIVAALLAAARPPAAPPVPHSGVAVVGNAPVGSALPVRVRSTPGAGAPALSPQVSLPNPQQGTSQPAGDASPTAPVAPMAHPGITQSLTPDNASTDALKALTGAAARAQEANRAAYRQAHPEVAQQYVQGIADQAVTNPAGAAVQTAANAASATIHDPVGAAKTAGLAFLDAINRPQQWTSSRIGEWVWHAANGNEPPEWVAAVPFGPQLYGATIGNLSDDADLKQVINQAHEQGGDQAVYQALKGYATQDLPAPLQVLFSVVADAETDPLLYIGGLGLEGLGKEVGARAAAESNRVAATAGRAAGQLLELPQQISNVTADLPFNLAAKGLGKAIRSVRLGRHLVAPTVETQASQAAADTASATDEVLARRQPNVPAPTSHMGPMPAPRPAALTPALPTGGITGQQLGSDVPMPEPGPQYGPIPGQPTGDPNYTLNALPTGGITGGQIGTSTRPYPSPSGPRAGSTIITPPPGSPDYTLPALPEPALVTPPPGQSAAQPASAVVPVGERRMLNGRVTRTVGDDGTVRVRETPDGRWEVQRKIKNRWTAAEPGQTYSDEGTALDQARDMIIRGNPQTELPTSPFTPPVSEPAISVTQEGAALRPAEGTATIGRELPTVPTPDEIPVSVPRLINDRLAYQIGSDGTMRVRQTPGGNWAVEEKTGRRWGRLKTIKAQPTAEEAITEARTLITRRAADITAAAPAADAIPTPNGTTRQVAVAPPLPTMPKEIPFTDWQADPHLNQIRPDRPQMTRTGERAGGVTIARAAYQGKGSIPADRAAEYLTLWKPLAEAHAADYADAAARHVWPAGSPQEAVSNLRFYGETELPLAREVIGDDKIPPYQWLYGAKTSPTAPTANVIEHAVWGSADTAKQALQTLVARRELPAARTALTLHNQYATEAGDLVARLFPDAAAKRGKTLTLLGPDDVPTALAGDLLPSSAAVGIRPTDPIRNLDQRARAAYAAWEAAIPAPPTPPTRVARAITEPFPGGRSAAAILTDPDAAISPRVQAILDTPFSSHTAYAGQTVRQVWLDLITEAETAKASATALLNRGATATGRRAIDRKLAALLNPWKPFGDLITADPETLAADRLAFERMLDEGYDPAKKPNPYTLFNQMTSQLLLHSPLLGWAYSLRNLISDATLVGLSDPAAMIDAVRGARTALYRAGHVLGKGAPLTLPAEDLASELLIGQVPRQVMERTAQETSRQRGAIRGFLNRIGVGRIPVGKGSIADLAKPWERKAELNQQLEGARRAGVWRYRTEQRLAEATTPYRDLLAADAARIAGLTRDVTDQVIDELPIAFGPQRLYDQVVKAARAAGVRDGTAKRLGIKAFKDWTKIAREAADQTVKDIDGPLPIFRQTNADRYIGAVIPFTFWHTRASRYVAQELLRHPVALTSYLRAQEALQDYEDAHPEMPTAVKGMLRLFTSPFGLELYSDPRKLLLTAAFFREEAKYASPDDSWYTQGTNWLRSHLAVGTWPVIDYAANTLGLSGDVFAPNPLPFAEQRLAGDVINAALGYMGHGPGDPIWDRANEWVRAHVSGIAAGVIPGAEPIEATNPNAGLIDNIDSMILDQNPDLLARLESDDPAIREAAGNEFAAIADNPDDPRYVAAYRAVAANGVFRDLWNGYSPLSVTARIQSRDALIGASAAGDETARDVRSLVTSAPAARQLGVETDAYYALGTERQQNLANGWREIAYDTDGWSGHVLYLDGYAIPGERLIRMTEDERKALADRWVATYNGQADLDAYRQLQDDYTTQHPEFADFDKYRSYAYDYDGGVRAFRRDMAKSHPEFSQELSKARERYQGSGHTGIVLENDLDRWATSQAGYLAFTGQRQSIYDAPPLPAYNVSSDPYLSLSGRNGSSGSGRGPAPKTTAQKLREDIAEYQAKAAQLRAILGIDYTALNPLAQQAVANRFGNLMPQMTRLMTLWQQWASYQPQGADTSPEAFGAYMQRLEDDAAAQLAPAG